MEPIKINIEVEVGLKQTTIDTLRQIFGPQIVPAAPRLELDEEPHPKTAINPAPTPEPDTPTPEHEKPKTKGADPEGTGVGISDDLPPDNAPDPVKKTPTESDARNAVAAAKKRGVTAAAIKSYMKTAFDISSSVECPAERRQELIDGLNRLAA